MDDHIKSLPPASHQLFYILRALSKSWHRGNDENCRRSLTSSLWFVVDQPVNQFYKTQKAPVPYPTVPHSQQRCTHGALWDMEQVHVGIFNRVNCTIVNVTQVHIIYDCPKMFASIRIRIAGVFLLPPCLNRGRFLSLSSVRLWGKYIDVKPWCVPNNSLGDNNNFIPRYHNHLFQLHTTCTACFMTKTIVQNMCKRNHRIICHQNMTLTSE